MTDYWRRIQSWRDNSTSDPSTPKKRVLYVIGRSWFTLESIVQLVEWMPRMRIEPMVLLGDLPQSDPIKIFDLDKLTPVEFEQIRAEIERLMVKA